MGRRPILKWQVKRSPPFPTTPEEVVVLYGISRPFGLLSPASGHVIYVLLTRAPLTYRSRFVRLACVKPAASVRSEPGSNSPVESWQSQYRTKTYSKTYRYSVFKDPLVNRARTLVRAEADSIDRLFSCQPGFLFFPVSSAASKLVLDGGTRKILIPPPRVNLRGVDFCEEVSIRSPTPRFSSHLDSSLNPHDPS